MKTYLILVLLAFGTSANAQYDDSFMFDEIGIEGQYEEQGASPADRMRKMRTKLEERNEQLVQKRIEKVRFKQEKEMMKRLQRSMNQTFQQIDENLDNM